jgi:signal transduction histidine kinase
MEAEGQGKQELMYELREDFISLFKDSNPVEAVEGLLNSMPSAAAILNPDRKSVYVNVNLLNQFGFDSVETLLGKRPGEMLGCLHAHENNDQCGISENCRMCGALNAIKKAQASQTTSVTEMRLTMVQNGIHVARDLKVTVSPLKLNGKVYMVLYLIDISNEKRRKVLEKIFFHDVLNKIASLSGLTELLKKESRADKHKEFMNSIELVLSDLTDEILAQRQLAAAENGELSVKKELIFIPKLLVKVANQVQLLNNPLKVIINISHDSENVTINTDEMLLNRIVTNMAKNAVEASDTNTEVTIKSIVTGKYLLISVNNRTYMNLDTQIQVFQRSFSTKGDGRGLGTYSIKLLSERYLGGKAYFKSDKENGTTFFVELPIV